jgi:hypothetical protein
VQIVVQEGRALISLVTPIQAPDENLRTTTVQSVSGLVKVMPSAIGGITWVQKDRRYQLKVGP